MVRSLRPRRRPSLLERLALRWLVHGEALLRRPSAYLTARYWLLVGRRVRGRNQLSPLIGATRFAYAAWIADREPYSWPEPATALAEPRLIFVIDARSNPAALLPTLESLQCEHRTPDQILVLQPEAVRLSGAHPTLTMVGSVPGLARALADMGGAFLVAVRAGDCLSKRAIELFRHAAASGAEICYGDDDLLGRRGQRCEPHFKPRWNAELYLHHDYISGAAAVRIGAAVVALLERSDTEDWIAAVTRAAIAAASVPPLHIPHVLVHRRTRPEPVTPPRTIVSAADDLPSLSVIIPTRNQLPLLEACLFGLANTRYPVTECLIVDNGSDDPATLAFLAGLDPARFTVLQRPGPFNFAALNNAAAEVARGEYLCLLNNDVSMTDPNWLLHLVRQAQRPEVGAVGARLHYPDGSVQHAGVVLGVCGGAAHAHRGVRPGDRGYFLRADLPQFVSAVTAACLVVARHKFLAVEGFDDEAFAVAFNDVDLCARLNTRGWQSLYEPRAQLVHHESKSRGTDLTPEKKARFAGELARLKQRWQTDRQVDPYHHPALCRFSDTFVVGL